MGTVINNSTLRALILEAFANDKSLLKDILGTLFAENPLLLEEYSTQKQDSAMSVKDSDPDFPVLEGLTAERKQWLNERIDKDFSKYHDVFKALA